MVLRGHKDSFNLRRVVFRAITACLLSSVFNLLVHWDTAGYNTLDLARQISLVNFLIAAAIGFEILTALAISLTSRLFDAFALVYAVILGLFLIVAYDHSTSLSLGILGLMLAVAFVCWPQMAAAGRDPTNRPYLLVLAGGLIPLVVLIFFRLFSSAAVSAFFTQKDAGLNLTAQIAIILFFGSAIGVLLYEWQPARPLQSSRMRWATVAAATAAGLHILLVGAILVFRYWSLRTSTYDFGLFAQMFTYLKETGQPLTTLERNGLLSHYAVHLSPIFYLLLPFFLVFPDPATLQILQPIVVASGLIPLLLLARHHRLSARWQVLLTFIYAAHPGLIGSSLYDLHENCFLAPLLLWSVYFLTRQKWPGIIVSTILVLAIKEDAALYLIAIAVFMLLTQKKARYGFFVLAAAAAYFSVALLILSRIGSGPMIGRFDNLMADPRLGLLSVPLTLLKNPGYLLSQIFTEDKIIYLIKMLLPVGFLPVLNRRRASWVLLVPFLVMNLIIDYPYQFVLRYQYHYGSAVLLIYMLLLQIAGSEAEAAAVEPTAAAGPAHRFPSRRVMTLGVGIALIGSLLFGSFLIKNSSQYMGKYLNNRPQLAAIKEALDTVPADASVQASTFFTPYLFEHRVLYDVDKNQAVAEPHQTEYVALDLRAINGVQYDDLIAKFEQQGFVQTITIEHQIMILQKEG